MGGYGRPPQRGGPRQEEAPLAALPKVTYFRGDGILEEKLLDESAEEQAKKLAEVAATQLRRFYDHVLAFRRMIDDRKEQAPNEDEEQVFLRIRPEFKMLRAKAYYAYGRAKGNEKGKIRPLFDFLRQHTASVGTAREFRAFCKHFEAVVAFHKVFERKESR